MNTAFTDPPDTMQGIMVLAYAAPVNKKICENWVNPSGETLEALS
jgi:hypothetical protein